MPELSLGDPSTTPAKRSTSRIVVAVAAVAALVVLVGGLFLVTRAGSEQAGAATPDEAATAMFAAIENEDLVALAELLHPGERRTLAEPAFDIIDELIRLEIIDGSLDLAAVDGVDVEIEGLQYRVEAIPGAADLREVLIDAGTLSVTADGEQLPIGETLRERFGDEISEIDEAGSESIVSPEAGPVLVEYEGRWYVSIWYSAAEALRGFTSDAPVPALADMPPAIGADTPEAAVDGLVDALVELDLTTMIGMLDPEEAAALYRYAPLFLDEAEASIDELLDEVAAADVSWSVESIEYAPTVDGDRASVEITAVTFQVIAEDVAIVVSYSPDALAVDANVDGETYQGTLGFAGDTVTLDATFEGVPVEAEVTFGETGVTGWAEVDGERYTGELTIDPDGVCSTVSFDGPDGSEEGCLGEFVGDPDVELLLGMYSGVDDLRLPTPSITATRHDGRWYVSPLLTLSDTYLTFLRGADADSVAAQLDLLQELAESGY